MKTRRKVVVLLAFIVLYTFIVSIPLQAALPQFSITPSRFEILLEPRSRTIQTITICNSGTEELNLTALTQDWELDEKGKLVLLEPATSARSASNWLRFNPKNIKVGPEKEQIIRFAVTAPPEVEPGEYRTAILLTTDETFTAEAELNIRPQFAILLYINIPAIKRRGVIENLEISTDDTGTYLARGEIMATGNAHLRVTGAYSLQNNDGQEVKTELLDKKVILPGQSDSFSLQLGVLEKGTYKLQLSWYYISAYYMEGELNEYPDGGEALVKEFEFEVK